MIEYIEICAYSFNERQLDNGKYRYEGYNHTIKYCVNSTRRLTEEELNNFLNGCSIEYLLNNENYIINLD